MLEASPKMKARAINESPSEHLLRLELDSQIGSKIRELRVEQRLTLEELSRRSNVPSAYLKLCEVGSARPNPFQLCQISEVLNSRIGNFFEREHEKETESV